MAVFARYARERIEQPYTVSAPFERLLTQVLRSGPWDLLVLGMHIMIESVALAAFRLANTTFEDPLMRQITGFTARDEGRHVSFGTLLLNGLYPALGEGERSYREEFVLEAADLLSRRYRLTEIWERLGIPVAEGEDFAASSEMMIAYQRTMFSRVVRSLSKVGLMTRRVQEGFASIGMASAPLSRFAAGG